MLEVAGVQVPVRLRQQLEKEKQAEERAQRSSTVARKVEDAPRLTHKLLRVLALHFELNWPWVRREFLPVSHLLK
jgi:hypothetical protein